MRELYWTPNGGAETRLQELRGRDPTRYAQIFCTEIVTPGYPADEPQVDEIPSLDMAIDRGVAFMPRVLTARFVLVANDALPRNLPLAIRAWDTLHNPRLGIGVLRHFAEDDTSRYIDARPKSPVWSEVRSITAKVEQGWYAANPWWRASADASYVTAFNNAVPVVVPVVNDGILAVPPTFTVTGIVDSPEFSNDDGDVIAFDEATVNADDVLVVTSRLGQFKALYYEHGAGAGVSWYKYRSSTTLFWEAPVGSSNVTIVAASGTAPCVLTFPRYYGDV